MWLWAGRPPQRPQPHEVNQVRLFGPLKRCYTQQVVVEIIFDHQTHTQANGDLIHDACDLGSTS
jgi:hypothetical protein